MPRGPRGGISEARGPKTAQVSSPWEESWTVQPKRKLVNWKVDREDITETPQR